MMYQPTFNSIAIFRFDNRRILTLRVARGGIHTDDETIGIALSPDNKRFYAGFQEGWIFEFRREVGLPFE